jgi:hypothetical protein
VAARLLSRLLGPYLLGLSLDIRHTAAASTPGLA